MIDEKKLIKAIFRTPSEEAMRIESCLYADGYLDGKMQREKEIVDIINSQPKTDWISCEERLPENDTNVIACFSSGTVTELRYLGNGFFQGIYEYNTKVIIAWQPLPQPYKKEGEADA